MKKKAKKAAATRAPARKGGSPRADYGKPIDGFISKQAPPIRAILVVLRKLVEDAAPDATSSLKWGQPVYTLNGAMFCALGGFKSHANLVVVGPPRLFADPDGRLEGAGKSGRHLKLRAVDEVPRKAVTGWVRAAARLARDKGTKW